MKIEVNSAPGDTVVYMEGGNVISAKVIAIQVRVATEDFQPKKVGGVVEFPFSARHLGIRYYLDNNVSKKESEVFKDREALANFILNTAPLA